MENLTWLKDGVVRNELLEKITFSADFYRTNKN